MQSSTNHRSWCIPARTLQQILARGGSLFLCVSLSLGVCCRKPTAQTLKQTTEVERSSVVHSVTADAARRSGPPLVKGKFGVYQTRLRSLNTILRSEPYLTEAQVRDIRYEIGIGKPGALARDQITGDLADPHYDFMHFRCTDKFLETSRHPAALCVYVLPVAASVS